MGSCLQKSSSPATNELAATSDKKSTTTHAQSTANATLNETENHSPRDTAENGVVENIIHVHSQSRKADSDDESDDDYETADKSEQVDRGATITEEKTVHVQAVENTASGNTTDVHSVAESMKAREVSPQEKEEESALNQLSAIAASTTSEEKVPMSVVNAEANQSQDLPSGTEEAVAVVAVEEPGEKVDPVETETGNAVLSVMISKEAETALPPPPLPPTSPRGSQAGEELNRQRSDSEDSTQSTQSTSSVFRAMAR
jgi:hypothetical protein